VTNIYNTNKLQADSGGIALNEALCQLVARY
jgi:hypothetical protein